MGVFSRFTKKSDFTIYDAVVILGDAIRSYSASCAQHFQQSDTEMDALGLFKLVLKIEFMFLHLIDKQAFVTLGPNKRNDLMDMLAPATFKSTIEASFSTIPSEKAYTNLLSEINDDYGNATLKYAGFKQGFPEENQSPSGTLFWEFGKTISEDPAQIIYLQVFLVDALKEINIQEFLQGLA